MSIVVVGDVVCSMAPSDYRLTPSLPGCLAVLDLVRSAERLGCLAHLGANQLLGAGAGASICCSDPRVG